MKKFRPALMICCLIILTAVFTGCSKTTLNGTDLAKYSIVYPDFGNEYELHAAEYLQKQIKAITDIELPLVSDRQKPEGKEILVGYTGRELSKTAHKTDRKNNEFVITADKNGIAIDGEQFLVAGGVYSFIKQYITGTEFKSEIGTEPQILAPQPEQPKNYFLLIGDGMGPMQTKLMDYVGYEGDEDVEEQFFGMLLPHHGESKTDSLSGITDSAASGTALSTGFKTINGYVGRDKDLKDLLSLTELAVSKGMKTAVMSTDEVTGATPASFSAHADSRDDSEGILESQKALPETVILCGLNTSTTDEIKIAVSETIGKLENDNGFFMMYEEGYIDKYCHSNQAEEALATLMRFDRVIGLVMEYAMYHPDTVVLITADHETGGIQEDGNTVKFTSTGHTSTNVPIFAYGTGSEVFDGEAVENTEIPKYFASLMGDSAFGN